MKKFLFIMSIFAVVRVSAGTYETPDLKSCLEKSQAASANIAPGEVLYVFDIDNTVLGLKQHLGSVQWYRWQQDLIKNGNSDRVASTNEGLLAIQGLLYHFSGSFTPEPITAEVIRQIQKRGFPVIYHTSRAIDVRDITERELRRNALLPLTNTIGPQSGYPGQFKFPVEREQRNVTFQNGIYMSAGQDKGEWLKFLLLKTNFKPQHLVFVDDEEKNLTNVDRAFKGLIPTTLCRYSRLDKMVAQFNNSDKSAEIRLWAEISAILAKFP